MSNNNQKHTHVGFQTLIELYGCSANAIDNASYVEEALLQVADNLNFTVVNSLIHHFSPIGVSGVIVIEESHIAVHTWPEFYYVAIDFFTCNQQYDIAQATDFLKDKFGATTIELQNIQRGDLIKLKHFSPKSTSHVR